MNNIKDVHIIHEDGKLKTDVIKARVLDFICVSSEYNNIFIVSFKDSINDRKNIIKDIFNKGDDCIIVTVNNSFSIHDRKFLLDMCPFKVVLVELSFK